MEEEKSYEDMVAEAEARYESEREEQQLKALEESRKYKNIISNYDDRQLVIEQGILITEETILYNKKKALKDEFTRRLRGV